MRKWLLFIPVLLALPDAAAAEHGWYDETEGSAPAQPNATTYQAPAYEVPSNQAGTGLGMALRLGYGMPFGKLVETDKEGADFEDFTAGQVVTQFDLTYAFTPSIVAGAYFGLSFGLLPDHWKDRGCDSDDVSCTQLFWSMGLSGEYRFLPGHTVNPWLGANVGMEWAIMAVDTDQGDASTALFGAAFGTTGGVDFELGRWGLGPFFGVQMGRYARGAFEGGDSDKIDERAFHYLLQFGVRARYQFAQR